MIIMILNISISTFLILLTLIGITSESVDRRILIGYRTVSAAQAHDYNEAGTPVYTGPRAGTRIGKGVYMTEIAGQWRKPNSWYCQITAKYAEFQHTPKAWIPQYDSLCSLLWNGGEAAINRYIESLGHGWRPEYTIRMSELDEGAPKDENSILIPPALLEQNGGLLGLRTWCAPDVEEMGDERADIEEWEGVSGERV